MSSALAAPSAIPLSFSTSGIPVDAPQRSDAPVQRVGNPLKWLKKKIRSFSSGPSPTPTHANPNPAPTLNPTPTLVPTPTTNANPPPATSPKDAYIENYNKARFYHDVKEPNKVVNNPSTAPDAPPMTVSQSIAATGLQPRFGGTGASNKGVEEIQSRNKVHLGTDLTSPDRPDNFQYGYPKDRIRPFLPASRTVLHAPHDTAKPSELNRDLHHPGEKWGVKKMPYAVTTQTEIPPESINFGSNREMLDAYRNGEGHAKTKFGHIQSHYPEGQKPTLDELADLHEQSLPPKVKSEDDKGYISD